MHEEEIHRAGKLYQGGLTLTQVRAALVAMHYPSRSINTIAKKLAAAGYQMRRPGRAKKTTL